MSTTDILLLAGFAIAFLGFGLVLAWGDFQTLDIARKSRERALSGAADSAGAPAIIDGARETRRSVTA